MSENAVNFKAAVQTGLEFDLTAQSANTNEIESKVNRAALPDDCEETIPPNGLCKVAVGQLNDGIGIDKNCTPHRGAWKRLILAAKLCRSNGNSAAALELYKRGLLLSHLESGELTSELVQFLETNFWLRS